MKKLITIFVLFLYAGIAQAQTEAETLEWLNAKKVEINTSSFSSNTVAVNKTKTLIIDNTKIRMEGNDESSLTISWSEIKDIKLVKHSSDYSGVFIVSNRMYEGKNVFTKLYMNTDIAPKYLKALKHMAMLKGAKLVDDDLFGN